MGLSCQYGIRLQWVEDSMARGICHGRQRQQHAWSMNQARRRDRPLPKSTKRERTTGASRPTFFVNTSNDDILYYLQVVHPESQDCLAPPQPYANIFLENGRIDGVDEFSLPCVARPEENNPEKQALANSVTPRDVVPNYRYVLPQTLSSPEMIRSLDQFDCYILQFYDKVVCSSTTLLDNEKHNPFRFLILPMVFSSANILNAVLAIGAMKLSLTDTRFRQRALIHRQRALTDLSGTLGHISGDLTRYLVALTSTLILCWCDVGLSSSVIIPYCSF
jgi:Fungal specific transcription factor domain